jgi:DNA (cytosine-5)-methyltransferase 1
MRVLDLFAGIGGFSLAAHWMGWTTTAFVEKDEYAQKVLAKNFPGVPIFDDVRTFDGTKYRDSVDLVCGGFPCQDISVAGAQNGIDAERSGLWSELHRIISEVRPRFALVENVTNLIAGNDGRWFSRVLGDLAASRFDAEWCCIPASKVGTPHIRDRVWILAYPASERRNFFLDSTLREIERKRLSNHQQSGHRWEREISGHLVDRVGWTVKPGVRGSDDDVPDRPHRLKSLGNSIVPQIAFEIFKAIEQA